MARRPPNKSNAVVPRQPDDLDALLHDSPTDEKQGAAASQGFSFQQWWAALAVAESLATDTDFAVGMEVKEDVALLDSPSQPTRIEFCQIKTNEQTGAWTLRGLHTKGRKLVSGDHEPSILAKLYRRRQEFSGHPTKLRFISNTSFKVPNSGGQQVNKHDEHLAELADADKSAIAADIAAQLSIKASDIDFHETRLHRTNLPLQEQEVFVGGMLGKLSEDDALPFLLTKPTVAARLLASQLQSLGSNTNYARNFSELRSRLLSRQEALALLIKVASAKPNISDVLDDAINRLNAEGHDFGDVRAIKRACARACLDAVDRTNLVFRDIARVLLDAEHIISNRSIQPSKLGDRMSQLVDDAKVAAPRLFFGHPDAYINAIALLVINDGIDINVFTTEVSAQSEEQK